MSEAGLFVRWGEAARGRERHALEEFKWSMHYFERIQEQGRIERFEMAFLTPHSGDLTGFILLRGTAKQIDSLRRDDDFRHWINRSRLVVDHFGVLDAVVDERLAASMSQYQDEIRRRDY